MSENELFDGVLMNVVQKSEGIEGFYNAVFGFMRRRTDFFIAPDKARSMVLAEFDKHAQLFKENKQREELIRKKQEEKRQEELKREAELKAKQSAAPQETDSKVEEITDEEAEKLLAQQTEDQKPPVTSVEEPADEGEGEDEKESGEPPLPGNGLRTDKYMFTQTLQDITINVFIPPHVKGKDLIVEYGVKHLKVQVKGQEPIINGALPEKINSEETIWTIDTVDGQRVASLTLDKFDKMKWWECAIVGDKKINTKKIEPENSKLSDLDGETRQTVEKMMFDQQQKQKGLPTSDELDKRDKLKAFMDAHPEMDFSKAKFN